PLPGRAPEVVERHHRGGDRLVLVPLALADDEEVTLLLLLGREGGHRHRDCDRHYHEMSNGSHWKAPRLGHVAIAMTPRQKSDLVGSASADGLLVAGRKSVR